MNGCKKCTGWIAVASLFILSFAFSQTHAKQAQVKQPADKAKVMLFGTFHFDDPGLDVVKLKNVDVMTAENQAYLKQFTQRVAAKFAPTQVLIECAKKETPKMNERYQEYLNGSYELGRNENYQIGFRLAKLAKVKVITCYDEREVEWQGEALMQHMSEQDAKLQTAFMTYLQKVTSEVDASRKAMTLQQVLQSNNNQEQDNLNKSLYIFTNHAGAFDSYVGADAAASWWHRNFRMYANVQALATPGERIFVVGGQGHMAILKDFAKLDPNNEAVAVNPLF